VSTHLKLENEKDALIRYINSLPIAISLKTRYCYLINNAFTDINIRKEEGIKQLTDVESSLKPNQRGPISNFIDRYRTSQRGDEYDNRSDDVGDDTSGIDIAVICALKDPELDRVLDVLSNVHQIKSNDEGVIETHIYYLGEICPQSKNTHATKLQVVAAHQSQMGLVDCAILASKLIQRWRPRYIIMTGVCGGRKSSEIRLGDIIVPKKIFTYQSGEYTDEGFNFEPRVVSLDDALIQRVELCKKVLPHKIIQTWHGPSRDPPRIRTDPLVCGDAIINKNQMLDDEVSPIHRKIIGVDMESYAVVRATELLSEYNTKPLIIKSVMDFAEGRSVHSEKAFAAFTSAQFLYHFSLSELI